MGWGVTTFIPFTSFYFVVLGALASADPGVGAIIMMYFGVARGAVILGFSILYEVGQDTLPLLYSLTGVQHLVGALNGIALAYGAAILGMSFW